jgi:phage terminase small subunit
MALTPKQENFCLAYLETGNASEAYRRAYDAENMATDTISRKAKELLDNGKITARLSELREPIMKRHAITVDDLLAELEEARQLALQTEAPAPAVSATMGKAKLLGLDKIVVDNISSDKSMTPRGIDASKLSTAALAEILAAADESATD